MLSEHLDRLVAGHRLVSSLRVSRPRRSVTGWLAEAGCQNIQGQLFGRALPIQEFEAFANRT